MKSYLASQILSLLIFGLLLCQTVSAQGTAADDLVTGLQGITKYNLPWYSGLLNFTLKGQNNSLHYIFFPSQNNPSTDPVLLWLNGGPGCSSLLGATQENGPFIFLPNSTEFVLNPWGWNKNASAIYFESPPGVGFSTTTLKTWNDELTAEANVQGLLQWYLRFPQYKTLDFYIAGESYAGIYIPTTATGIINYNQQAAPADVIKLKGIAVGNGCTSPYECGFTFIPDPFLVGTLYDQGFYTTELRNKFIKNCQSVELMNTLPCIFTYLEIQNFMGTPGNQANIYDLIGLCYYPMTNGSGTVHGIAEKLVNQGQAQWLHQTRYFQDNKSNDPTPIPGMPPCADGLGPYLFFNNPQVKQALHVNTQIQWTMCTDQSSNWTYTRSTTGSYNLYPNLIANKLRIWIYSGDADGAVPTLGTFNWINSLKNQLKLSTLINWRGWYQGPDPMDPNPNNRQNAGQFWQLEGLTLVTFKGVGHMVPQYNRIGALEMINTFMAGGILPAQ